MVDPKFLNDEGEKLFSYLDDLQKSKCETELQESADKFLKGFIFKDYNDKIEKAKLQKMFEVLLKKLKIKDNKSKKNRIIVVKAVLINLVMMTFPNDHNKNDMINRDLSFIIFDLLEKSYYTDELSKLDGIDYRKRRKVYMAKNSYLKSELEHTDLSQRCRRIRSTMADYLSKLKDPHLFLKEAAGNYIKKWPNGEIALKLQKPYFTPENPSSLAGLQSTKYIIKYMVPTHADYYYEGKLDPVSCCITAINDKSEQEGPEIQPSTENMGILPIATIPVNTDITIDGHSEKESANTVGWKRRVKNTIISFYRNIVIAILVISHAIQGFNHLSIILPGLIAYISYEATYYDVTTKVRLVDDADKTWKKEVDAKIGDKVDFLINYTNTSDVWQNNVIARDILPSNLKYVPGSTFIKNGAHPDGAIINEDDLVGTGLYIGSYAPNANALIRFQAEVVNDNFTCGKFVLNNWGRSTVGNKLIQDSAAVNVQLAYCPNPENPT